MDIVEELRKDRESGARRLEAEYKAGLMSLARRFFADESDAEEIVNGTFAKVVEHIDEYIEQSAFFGWICQILMSEISRRTRRKSNQVEVLADTIPEMADPDAQEAIYRSLDHSLVRGAIEELPESDREVLILRYFMDIPISKMAKVLSLPIGTVHSRLHYARKALAAKLGVAASKPAGRALMLALALLGIAALGAGIFNLAKNGEALNRAKAGEALDNGGARHAASVSAANAGFVLPAPSGNGSPISTTTKETTTMRSTTLLSAALGASIVTASPFAATQEPAAAPADAVLYDNDFSARSGASAVPSWRWRGYDYAPGTVAYNYANAAGGAYAWTDGLAWADPSKIQDGWVLSGNGTWAPGPGVVTNNAAERPGDTERPFLSFNINNANFYSSRAYQPIGNSFTNGVVEYWVDMRAPGKWGNTSSAPYFRFFPVYRAYLESPDGTVHPPSAYPGKFGPYVLNSATKVRFWGGSSYNGSLGVIGTSDGGDFAVDSGRWYRFRMVVNFETHWCLYSAWALGYDVPTWDTAVGTRLVNNAGKYIYRDITDATGPLDGIGFEVGGINSGNPTVVTNTAAATNIRIGWKAHNADAEFIPCYSNDFRTCWRRSLADAATESAYAAPSGTGESAFSSYYVNSATSIPGYRVVSDLSGSGWQGIGMDGWKRIHTSGNAYPSVAATGDAGGNVLRVTQGQNSSIYYCVLGNTLGETVTSGKAVLEADVRLPDKWYWETSRSVQIGFADDYAYSTATGGDFGSHVLSRAGFTSASTTSAPYIISLDNTSLASDTATTGAFSTWYRVRLVSDLDAKTTSYSWWNLGASGKAADYEPDGAPFAEKSGAIRSTLSEISTILIYAYAVGNTSAGAALFDNIKVWKIPTDGATTNLVYSNDFNVRRRFNAPATAELADAPNVVAAERDFWIHRGGNVSGPSLLASSGNACLAMEAQGSNPACVVQDMGAAAAKARAVSARIDMRPPSIWHANTPARASFLAMLGGDALHGASTFGGTAIPAHARIRFGFGTGGSTSLSLQRLTSVKAVANDGASDRVLDFTVDPTHWYRFEAKANMETGGYSLSIYDQGTAHPASSDAKGALVASLQSLSIDNSGDTGGLSTLAFLGSGLANAAPTSDDATTLGLIDNVVVENPPSAFVMIIR